MNKEITKKVFEYIDALAVKLNVAAEHVYGVLIKQQYVEAIGMLLSLLLVLSIIIAGSIIIKKGYEKEQQNIDNIIYDRIGDLSLTGFGIYAVVGMATISILVSFIAGIPTDIVGKLINPEFYALKELFDGIKRS